MRGTRAVVHYTVGAQAVGLQVDTERGEIEVLEIASAYDVGKAINRDLIRTQIEGSAMHAMSSAVIAFKSRSRRITIRCSGQEPRIVIRREQALFSQ